MGIISEKQNQEWFGIQDDNPFAIFSESVTEISTLDIGFGLARKHLKDERVID